MGAAAEPPGRLPTFLILGAPKAGTTALAGYLAAHPEVFLAREKEVHFFDRRFDLGVDWYRTRFAEATTELAIGEASPTYMYADEALERIASVLQAPRLIVLLRNPIDRAYSQFLWDKAAAKSASFDVPMRAEMRAENGGRTGRYLGRGFYLDRLKLIASMFGRESLLVLITEEMESRPADVFHEVCRFVAVSEGFVPSNLGARINPAAHLRSPWLLGQMIRWKAWRRLPAGWAEALDRWNRPPRVYRPLDSETRAELREWYAEHNAALARWLGRDLSVWDR